MPQKYNPQKAISKLVSTTIIKFVFLSVLKSIATLLKTSLLLSLAAAMVFVNFRVDSLHYFYSDPVNRQYADYLRQGYALDNYTRMNERVVRTRYLEALDVLLPNATIQFTPQPYFFETTTEWAATLQDLVEEYRRNGSCDTAGAMKALKNKLDIAVEDIVIE